MAELKERYDRQIRVWGAAAQERIQTSKVLLLGLKGLNVEVVKNIVLAGMSVTIQDHSNVKIEDLSYNFFLTTDDVGKLAVNAALPRIQQLNTFTAVEVETRPIERLDDAFFKNFTVILMSSKGCTEKDALRINHICRNTEQKKVFFLSDVFGGEGMFISDFGAEFKFQLDKKEKKEGGASAHDGSTGNTCIDSNAAEFASSIQTINFPSLEVVLGKQWALLPSRHFPLSKTFLKSRLLSQYRDQNEGSDPTLSQLDSFIAWAEQIFRVHNIEISSLSRDDLTQLCHTASGVSVLTCSTLGSFLAQETIKAVSLSGTPGFNVFVFSCEDYQVRAFPVA